jgi:hypothetical protein
VILERTDALHLFLIEHLAGARARAPDALDWWRQTQLSDEEPEDRSIYVILVATCWSRLIFVLGVPILVIGVLLQQANDSLGTRFVRVCLAFTVGFCCTGMADMFWRSLVVRAARGRYRRAKRKVDAKTRRLMRVARFDDRVLVIQLLVAVFAVWRFA